MITLYTYIYMKIAAKILYQKFVNMHSSPSWKVARKYETYFATANIEPESDLSSETNVSEIHFSAPSFVFNNDEIRGACQARSL